MPYYDTCPDCGAHLDPGERCDCRNTQPQSQFLSVSEVAERWAVSTDLVYSLIRSGDLAAMKIAGTTWRIPLGAVIAYEQDRMNTRKRGKLITPRSKRKPVLRL